MDQHIIIIGGGQAGAQVIASARQHGWTGPITLIGAEEDLPYQRPPLSKAYMKGEFERERLYLKPSEFYEKNDVTLRLGERVTAIDRAAKAVELEGGERLSYGKLVIATGARVRPLTCPGDETPIHYLRSLADADTLRERFTPGTRVGVIGGGYIGLEAAASARQLGCPVSVVEAAERIMARVTCEHVSDFFQHYHAAQGVHFHTDSRIERLERLEGEAVRIHLHNGRTIDCDIILAGIGVEPEVELAQSAGLACENGIVVDHHACTEDPNIYAAGDCTNLPSGHYGERMRLESVHNAIEQAKTVALHLCGKETPYDQIPWFWSDQYDLKLQTAGMWAGHDETVLRGDPESKSFAVFYLSEGHLIAVDAINAAPEFMGTRKILPKRPQIPAEELTDTSVPFIEIAKKYA